MNKPSNPSLIQIQKGFVQLADESKARTEHSYYSAKKKKFQNNECVPHATILRSFFQPTSLNVP